MENFEELGSENTTFQQGSISGNGGGEPTLKEADRKKLDGIVQKMIQNKESDENIKFVVNDFKKKYGTSQPKGVTTEQNTASQSASVNGGSLSASGDVRPKGYEGLTKKPKTFLEKAQEAEEEQRRRPKIGQEQKINIADKIVEKKIPQKKVDTLGKKIDTKVKENYYSNTDADSRWNDIKQPSSKEAINVFNNYPNLNTSGVNIIDFAQFLKNNTRYFEDKNIDNNNKTESEFVKNKYLQDYLKDRINFLENKLKYTKPEDKNNYNKVVSELNSINDKYENYVNTYLPEFAKLRNETILKQKENYSRIKKGDLSQYYNDVKNLGERFIKGGTNPILDMINTGLDKVGAENLADKLRVDRNITEYKSNMNNITNAKGSVVNYNNNEYIVTSSGEIIDSDTKTVINSFTDKNTINKIYDLTKKSDKVKTLYSGRGYANSFSDLAGNLTTQILLTKGAASAAAKVGLGVNLSTKVGEITSVFGMVGASTYEQTLQELRDAGITDEVAKTEANKIAALTATASAVSSYFMPNANANKVTQGLNTKLLIKESIDVLKKDGKEGLADFLKTKASKIIYNSPDIIKEGGGEFLQEILEGKTQYIANQNANTEIGKQILQEGFKEGELLDTFILSATAGSLAASLGKAKEGAFGMDIKENFEYLSNIDINKIDKIGNNLVNSGDITQEEFTNLKNQVRNYRNNKSKLPSNIKGKKAVDATQLIAERENLKQQRKNLDEVFHPEIDTKIESINNQLKGVLSQPETTEDNAVQKQTIVERNEEINSEESLKTTLDNGVWGMLTAENPEAKKLSDEENAVRNLEAKKWLEEKGYKPKEIKGKYGNEENSFFVPNLSKQDAIEFARTFNQESVATNEGLVYQDGSFNPRTEGVEVGGNYEDFYSTMKIGDKDVAFQVNYNFDEKINEPNQTTTTTEEVTVPNQEGKNTGNDEVLRTNIESPAKYKEVAVSEKSRGNMTEDGEGNFVFYHYSPVQFDQLDPSKSGSNKSAITSSTETGAWSSAGGVNYLYTRDGQRERMVKGDYGYEFKVPMDKVYDTDADVNNYGEEAERRYAESHNGAKPNANVKTALITQIASENGYQVTVTSWEGTTRAQTNQPLTPSDTLVMNGTKMVKDFTKKYESNYDKKLASEERYDFNTVRDLTNHLQDKYVKSGKMENVVGMQQGAVVKRIMDADIPEAYKKLYVDLLEKEGMTGALNSIPQDTKDRLKQVVIPDNETVEKMSTPDKAIKMINKMLDDLDKFSKGTAGINIAIPVAKAALQTVKAAIKAGKSISQAIQAGTDYVKNSSWYKNLSDSDKAEFDSKGLMRSIEEAQAKQVAETIVKSETVDNKKSTKATVRENTGQTDTSPKVTTTESKLLKEKFKNLQRGFKEGVKETKQMKRDFIEQVKSSIKGLGSFITEQDAKTILNQVANVNDKNIDKISEVIDNLVSRLENRANKAKVNKLAKMQRKAKVKARTKYGNAGEDINKLIKLPANQIPEAYFDRYFDLMQKLSKGEPVNFNEVADLYSDLKTEIESFIDRKNNATKDKKEPDVDKVNEAKSNLKGKINFAKLSTPKNKLTDFEKRVLKSFFEIPNSYLDQLSLAKLNELNKALDYFISTGYMPNKVLSDFVMKYKSEQTTSNIINKVGDIVLKPVLSITGMIDKIKNKGFTSDDFFKNIQNNMLHHIDSTIKGIKGTLFYDNIVHPITSNFNKSDSETNKIGREVAEKLNAASKSEGSGFKVNVRLQMFFRQREFESNPELRGDKVFSLDDHMLSTKENENSLDYTKDDLDLIYQMYDEMKGKSSDEMLDMMTKEEKDLIDYMDKKIKEREISSRDYNNHLLGETLIYPKDYFPRKASFTDNNYDEASEIKARLFGMTGATSVRADSSNQRTANKANPLDFNSVANFMTNIRQSNIEKNLAFHVKQTLMTISNLKKSNDKSMITLANALEKTVKSLIEVQLGKNPYSYDSKGEQLFNKFTRNTVTRMLVDPIRLIIDVAANYPTVYGAFIDKLPAIKKANSNITNEVSSEIYKNISSTQSERVGGTASSDYKNAMTTPISKTSNIKAKVSPMETLVDLYKHNILSDYSENAGNLYYQIADLPARHLWKYYLSEEFRNITGNEFDGKKYLSDKNYREEVQESLQKAATSADKKTANYFNTGASSEQKLKIQGTKNNFLTRVNNFLRSFTFNEHKVFWDSLKGITGFGNTTFDSKSEAMRAFFVVNARGIIYSYLGSVIGEYLVDFVTGDDEEEKEMIDKKALKRSIGQHAALIALGNKGMIANFIGTFIGEQINARLVEEEKGKYNPYEDNMFYVPHKKSKYIDFLNNLGAEGAAIKTVVDFGSVVFNIYEKIESDEEVTKEDLVRYKTARYSVSLVSQATGLPIDKLGKLAQKALDKKYPYKKKNKPKKISDSTWGQY
jgi:hypothetical protein